jgi:hypothetical protein
MPLDVKEHSLWTRVLNRLELDNLYNAINFDTALGDPYYTPYPYWWPGRSGMSNTTVMAAVVDVFLCPEDPGGDPGWTGGCNYRVNLGSDRWNNTFGIEPTEGPIAFSRFMSPAATTDGLSTTALLSEKLRGRVHTGPTPDPRTDMIGGGLGWPYTPQQSLDACRARKGWPDGFFSTTGLTWAVGSLAQTCYNHTAPPDSELPDCILGKSEPPDGHFSARSNHDGGVHAAMADGSVRFVSRTIDPAVWSALGTRAGGEVIGNALP